MDKPLGQEECRIKSVCEVSDTMSLYEVHDSRPNHLLLTCHVSLQ